MNEQLQELTESVRALREKIEGRRFASDPTEGARREMVSAINADPGGRADLESKHGQVWDTSEMQRDFKVLGFMAPFIGVIRKSDGVKGSLKFQHRPRFYYGFSPD